MYKIACSILAACLLNTSFSFSLCFVLNKYTIVHISPMCVYNLWIFFLMHCFIIYVFCKWPRINIPLLLRVLNNNYQE